MNKRIVSFFLALIMLVGFAPAYEIGAAAASAQTAYAAQPVGPGRLTLSGMRADTAYRLLLPDGTRTSWIVLTEDDADSVVFEPLDGGEYSIETCPVSALTVLDAQADYLPEKYDLFSDVPASEIHTSEKIAVAQPEDEGDNVVDLAEGDVLLSSSYNDYAVFANKHDLFDSDLELSSITDAPAIRYVSADNGLTWKKLTGDVTLTSSAAEPVASGVSYALKCGDYPMTLTLDNLNTTGTILTAPIGDTIVKIKGDVSIKRLDTDYLGNLTVLGADSSAKLTVTRAIVGSCVDIRDLAELKVEGYTIAINGIMGDVKLTNIPKLDITASSEMFATGIRSYDGNVIFTDVFGAIDLFNDPNGMVIEVLEDKQFIINASDSCVESGADSANPHPVTLMTAGTGDEEMTGVFPADQLSAYLSIRSTSAND